MGTQAWSIPGSDGEAILGDTHRPEGQPRGVILIAHGFKGYKDYGMFPHVAAQCAASGLLAHRFNFSHSGMTNDTATFARPDLFERDTWNRQVGDLLALTEAIGTGGLEGEGLPLFMFGHSRGGVSVLLAAGRLAGSERDPAPRGVITAAAPSTCCGVTEAQQSEWRAAGKVVSPSSRTGQDLVIDVGWLDEQRDQPEAHDLLAQVTGISCPISVIHGAADPTVPAESATLIGDAAADARIHLIPNANHVFNTPNPFPFDGAPSRELGAMMGHVIEFTRGLVS